MVDLVGSAGRAAPRRARAAYRAVPVPRRAHAVVRDRPRPEGLLLLRLRRGRRRLPFVEVTEGLDFKGALELLADRYGVELELEEEDPRAAERRRQRERLLELLERTAAYYVRVLWESDEAARRARVPRGRAGWRSACCASSASATRRAPGTACSSPRAAAGFSDQELADAGLAQRAREGDRRLRPLPPADHVPAVRRARAGARLRGARGRRRPAAEVPQHRGDAASSTRAATSSAADLARAHATKAGEVMLAEGYTDVIALHQAGLRNTVGLMGTALTEEQVGELARLAPASCCWRSTPTAPGRRRCCARRGSRRAGGSSCASCRCRPGSDPADLVQQQGAGAMRALVERSVPFVRFRVERELERGDTGLRGGQGPGRRGAAAGVRDAPAERAARGAARRRGRPARPRAVARGVVARAPGRARRRRTRPAAGGRPADGRTGERGSTGGPGGPGRDPRGGPAPVPAAARAAPPRPAPRSTPRRAPSARSWPRRSRCPRRAPSSSRSSTRSRTSRRT